MFPNFRLMIAAALASVVALVSGFGVFASFHVGHRPLVRLPPANASLQQLRADYAVTLPITASEPFEHRFRIGEPAAEPGMSALAYSAIQPNDQPVMKAVAPAADDPERDALATDQAPPPVDRDDAAVQQTAVADAAADARPDEAARDTKQDPAPAEAVGPAEPSSTPSVAAIEPAIAEPPAEQAGPVEQTGETEIVPASPAVASAPLTFETVVKAAEKKTKHTRVAKAHRAHRARAGVAATTQSFKPNSTFPATTFQTAAQAWPPQPQKQPAKAHRSKTAAKATPDVDPGMGGPLVGAPPQ